MPLPEMECPICGRVWTPTMFDDCLLPACGCFGSELDRQTPCEPCGLAHAWNCPKRPGAPEHPETPKFIELWPDGSVVQRPQPDTKGA